MSFVPAAAFLPAPPIPATAAAGLALALAASTAATAVQPQLPPDPGTVDLPPIAEPAASFEPFRLDLGVIWQDDPSLGGGGRLGLERATLDAGVRSRLDGDWTMEIGVAYELTSYDFSNAASFSDTWGDVHQADLRVTFEYRPDDAWTLFAAPVLRYAGEDGADFGDALTGGAFLGFAHTGLADDVVLGFGVTVLSSLEDDARFVPTFIADWEILDGLRFVSGPGSRISTETLVQLVWEADEDLEIGAGVSVLGTRRFRLDDAGAVPGGIGEEEGRQVFLRATWRPTSGFDLTGTVGLTLEDDFELESSQGEAIIQRATDEGLVLGLRGSFRF